MQTVYRFGSFRSQRFVNGGDVVRHYELTDINIQQFQYIVYHGSVEKNQETCN